MTDEQGQQACMTRRAKLRRQRIGFKKREPGEMPGFSAMAKNLIESAKTLATKGIKTASKEERERRLAICRDCEHIESANTQFERCRQCGCVLAFKSALAALGCPLKKW